MKYIIEIPDEVEWGVVTCRTEDGFFTRDFDSLEELNSDYINEHYGSLQDEAYKRGINDGSLDVKQRVEGAYQRGLDDAWEAARNISLMSPDEIEKVFPGAAKYNRYNLGYSGVEAIEKLKAYEEKQNDKIKVGDEVEPFYTDITGVVTLIDGDTIYILWCDGSSTSAMKLKEVTKTGRHFNIASILEDMRND